MESFSKELALAIRLTKILSGKEEVTCNPTKEFFDEIKEHLGSELSPQLRIKALYFLVRITQKPYTQLLVQEQEYALWLALALLEKHSSYRPLIFKSQLLALKVLGNLGLYLQHQELVTEEEQNSWQRCEPLLTALFQFLHKNQPFTVSPCPAFLESSFPAFFMPAALPDDFTSANLENSIPQSFSLFDEVYAAQKVFLNFITQVFKHYNSPIHMIFILLDLIATSCKVTDYEAFTSALESFKAWNDMRNDIGMSSQLIVLFGRIELGENVPQSLNEQILLQLCKLLIYNEQHFTQYYVDLLNENTLIDLCTAIIERLQPVTADSSLHLPNLKISGYGKEHYEEIDTSPEEFCTYHRTGTNYEMQHWYYCYTCKLVANKGTCNVCAKKCHAGHQIVYSRKGNFFCDCGDNQGSPACKCMPKGAKRKSHASRLFEREQDEIEIRYEDLHSSELRDLLGRDVPYFGNPNDQNRLRIHELQIPSLYSSPQRSLGSAFVQMEELPQYQEFGGINISSPPYEIHSEDIHSESDEEEKKGFEEDSGMEIEIEDSELNESEEEEEEEGDPEEDSKSQISSDNSEEEKPCSPKKLSPAKKQLPKETLEVCEAAMGLVKRTISRLNETRAESIKGLFYPKIIEYSKQLSKVLCTFKGIASPLKVPYTDHRELKELTSKYPGIRNSLAICHDIGIVLSAEGNRLLSLDSSLFNCTGNEVERSNITVLAKNVFPFHIMSITVNPNNNRLVAICGVNQCAFIQLTNKQHKGHIEKKISFSLISGESKLIIVKSRWLPGSQTELAICTTEDIRIFDFSRDIICPVKCFRSLAIDLTDLVIYKNILIASSSSGVLYRQEIIDTSEPLYMSETIQLPGYLNNQKIISVNWADSQEVLIVSMLGGRCLFGKLNKEATGFTNDLYLDFQNEQSSAFLSWSSAALNHILSVPTADSLVCVGLNRKSSSIPILVKITDEKCTLNPLKKSTGYVEGICIYSHNGKHILLSQYDDGSLLTNSILLDEETQDSHVDLESLNKYLTLEHLPQTITMPITFFEKAIPLNTMRMFGAQGVNRNDVVISGDPAIAFGNSKIALEKLSFDRNADTAGLISTALPDPSTITITVSLEGTSASTLALCGFKMFVETGPGSHIEIMNRKIQLQYQKRWYDLPLCDIEIVKGYLNKQITVKIVTQNAGRHPIRLFHFEIFGFSQATFALDSKLVELSKAALGLANSEDQIYSYKHLNWKKKFSILDSLPGQQKELIVYLNALASTIPANCTVDSIISLIINLSIQNFSSPNSLYSIAIKDCLKNLLSSMNLEENYTALKGLVLCYSMSAIEKPSEKLAKAVVKSLSHLIRDQLPLFFFLLNSNPKICSLLDETLNSTTKLQILDDYLKVLLYAAQFFINKAIKDIPEPDKIAAIYHMDPNLAEEPISIIINLLKSSNSSYKEEVITKINQHAKKHAKMWLKQIKEKSPYLSTRAMPLIYDESLMDISTQIQAILSISEKIEINIYCGDICYLLIYNLCADWKGPLYQVDGLMCMLDKLVKLIEKLWVKEEFEDSRYYTLISNSIKRELDMVSPTHENEGRVYFLFFMNILTSYFRPKDDKYSKAHKIHRSIVTSLIRHFTDETFSKLFFQLQINYTRFSTGKGSIKALYKNDVLEEVNEEKNHIELIKPENPMLMNEWEGAFGSEIFATELDQFLISNLIDLCYNLVTGSNSEVIEKQKDILELIDGGMQIENFEQKPHQLSSEWVNLLIKILLEPSLQFLQPSADKLLQSAFLDRKEYLLAYHMQKIDANLASITKVMNKTSDFRAATYYDTLGLLKQLTNIKNTILNSQEILPEIFKKFITESNTLRMLISMSLTLLPPVNQECLSILNSIIKTENLQEAKIFVEQNSYIWEELLDTHLPIMIDKLSLYGDTQFANYIADLLLGLFRIANSSQIKKLVVLMLDNFQTMINLGVNSKYFLTNIIEMMNSISFNKNIYQSFCNGIVITINKSSNKLSENIDAEVYDILMTIFSTSGFHWFILDPEPCLKCFGAEEYKLGLMKLADLQSEIRFSDSCFFTRFKDPVKVSKVEIKLTELRGHKAITGCTLYFCNKDSQDLTELKNNWSVWHKIKTVNIKPASTNMLEIDLTTEITMLNLLIEFHTVNVIRVSQDESGQGIYTGRYLSGRSRYSFLSNKAEIKVDVVGVSVGNEREVIPCPRCNKVVEDKYGICSCGENAFQCLQCRNINYENLDAFLCTECGESRYCKIEILLQCSIDAIYESITSSKELSDAEAKIDTYLETIQAYYEHLPKSRETLCSLANKLKGYSSKKEFKEQAQNKEFSPIIYNIGVILKEFQDSYYDMMICVKSVVLLRHAIMNYKRNENMVGSTAMENSLTNCFGCNYHFLKQLLKSLKMLKNKQLKEMLINEYNIIEILVQNTIRSYSQPIRKKGRKVLIELAYESEAGCRQLFNMIRSHITSMLGWKPFLVTSVREEVQLLLEITSKFLQPSLSLTPEFSIISELTLKEFWHIFFIMLEKSWEDSRVGELISSFLDSILDMIFKTLILIPDTTNIPDSSLTELFINNPAFIKTRESPTNTNEVFMNSILNGSCYGLYDKWQNNQQGLPSGKKFSLKNNWLVDCLLYAGSARVQDLSRMILLCLASSGIWDEVLKIMLEVLPQALEVSHQGSDYYFTVLYSMLTEENCTTNLVLEQLLKATELCVQQVLAEQEKAQAKGAYIVNISLGHGLVCLLNMISNLSTFPWGKEIIRNSKNLANYIINSFLNVRKIHFVKNKVISESQGFLEKLFDLLHLDCSEEQRHNFLLECIEALLQRQDDPLAQSFLIQQITRIIAPAKPEPVYCLRLEKAPTQEEFIRGNMEKNPYSSKEVGPLMSNVRERICKELEYSDPEILELLVADQIVAPSLSVNDVYEHVLWPTLKNLNSKYQGKNPSEFSPDELPPMVITFRLAGLDGEATENIIESIPGTGNIEEDPEIKYAITSVLGQDIKGSSMIAYCLELLRSSWIQHVSDSVLNLLYYSCQISINRHKLCETGGVPVLFDILHRIPETEFINILKIISLLIEDPNTQPYIARSAEPIKIMLNLLMKYPMAENLQMFTKITHFLPYLCHTNYQACRVLVNFFKTQINISSFNQSLPATHEILSCLVLMLDNLPAAHSTLRDEFLSSSLTQQAVAEFTNLDPYQISPQNAVSILKVLKGLMRAHPASQSLLKPALIEKIFNMKNASHDIGPAAEMLIEAILENKKSSNPAVSDLLEIMILNEDEQRKEKANKKREEVLKQFQVSDLNKFGDMLDEEIGLACVICKEGYTLRPDDLLGFYVFVTPVQVHTGIENPAGEGDVIPIMSLVTHFNPIHLSCHREAARAEKNMKKPKSEWEGATIRNQHTKCNNWYPIWGPKITRQDYSMGVQRMFSSYNLMESRVHNEIHNLRLQLQRFGLEESFSKESKGGGPEHNLQAIPYMLHMIWFLLEEEPNQVAFINDSIEAFMGSLENLKQEQLVYFMTLCLVMMKPNKWNEIRVNLIEAAMKSAKNNPRIETKLAFISSGNEASGSEKCVLGALRVELIVMRLIDLIFGVLFQGLQENQWKEQTLQLLQSGDPIIQDNSMVIFEEYKRFLNITSLEEVLNLMNLRHKIVEKYQSLANWFN